MERIRSLAQQQQITPALPSSGAAAVRAEVRLLIYSGIMPSNMYGRYIIEFEDVGLGAAKHIDSQLSSGNMPSNIIRKCWVEYRDGRHRGQFAADVMGNTKENKDLNILRIKKKTLC